MYPNHLNVKFTLYFKVPKDASMSVPDLGEQIMKLESKIHVLLTATKRLPSILANVSFKRKVP